MVWTPKLRIAVMAVVATTSHAAATSGNSAKSDAGSNPGTAPLPKVHTPQTPQWPKTLPPAQLKAPVTPAWPANEVKAERERCTAMLAGLDIVSIASEPIREGECGAAAPIELISVGRNPQVTFSTPAIVTCDMAVAFDKWLKTDLQAAAREHLGSPVVRVEIMSSYSCRTAYGRKKSRLSEHGRANALDIRGFLTEKGAAIDLQADWGQTNRDIKAQIAAAAAKAKADEEKAELIKREAEKAAAARAPTAPSQTVPQPSAAAGTPGANAGAASLRGRVDDAPVIQGGVHSWRPTSPALTLTPPARLGGPKADKKDGTAGRDGRPQPPSKSADQQSGLQTPPPQTAKARFLRRAHTSACQTFGTILGPESNEAHRNHFHIDMAERQNGNYCE